MQHYQFLNKKFFVVLTFVFLLSGYFLFFKKKEATTIYRWNQVGYAANRPFEVLVFQPKDKAGTPFVLFDSSHQTLLNLKSSPQEVFKDYFVRRVFLPALKAGDYYISIDGEVSPRIRVKDVSYKSVIESSLEFFRGQRCEICHQEPQSLQGGWHDAGDYIRFALTSSFATVLLGTAAVEGQDKGVFEEALWGVKWLDKMLTGAERFSQIGDIEDHASWRLPEDASSVSTPPQVYKLSETSGANLVGRLVVSMALLSEYLNKQSPADSLLWKNKAIKLYELAQSLKSSQSASHNFYQEDIWQDDLALAALELYHLTAETKYLEQALRWTETLKNPFTFDYAHVHVLVYYKLAKYSPKHRAQALHKLREIFDSSVKQSQKNIFGYAVESFFWGCHMHIQGMALAALFYNEFQPTEEMLQFAHRQWDYLFGLNQWGVSFVSPFGEDFLRHPHHQIADIKGLALPGYWAPGPVAPAVIKQQKIELKKMDRFEKWQSEKAVVHDDVADYVTNEPTISMTALGILLTTWMGR